MVSVDIKYYLGLPNSYERGDDYDVHYVTLIGSSYKVHVSWDGAMVTARKWLIDEVYSSKKLLRVTKELHCCEALTC